jgi:hypothetical protein
VTEDQTTSSGSQGAETVGSIDTRHLLLVGAGPGLVLGDRIAVLYSGQDAPGVIVYNAVVGAPDQLLSSSVAHLQTAYQST